MILSSNGRDEVIRAHCYCDRARLAATKCSNRWDDVICARCYYDIFEKIDTALLPSHKEMPTHYSPHDHPTTRSRVLVGKSMRMSRNAHTLSDILSRSYYYGFISLRRNMLDIFMGSYCCHAVGS
jgi:hypothetical protein